MVAWHASAATPSSVSDLANAVAGLDVLRKVVLAVRVGVIEAATGRTLNP